MKRSERMTLNVAGEQAAIGLLEAGLLALGLNLSEHRGVDGCVRRLAVAGPHALVEHDSDDIPAAHRLPGVLENLGSGVQSAGRPGLHGLGHSGADWQGRDLRVTLERFDGVN